MTPLETAGLALFFLVLFLGMFSTIFGLPGTAIIFLDVLVYAAVTGFHRIGLGVLLALALIMVAAEAIEFFLGVLGAARFGASKQGLWASVLGGILGALLLTPSLLGLGAVAGAFFGGFAGTLLVEMLRQHKLKPAFRAAKGAMLGRIAGTAAKGLLCLLMIAITVSKIYS